MSHSAARHGQDENARVNPGAGEPREPADDASPDEIEADIARTRRELGETVEALSDKLDPKAQADEQISRLTHRAREQVDHARERARSTLAHARHTAADPRSPVPALLAAVAGATVFAAVGLLITRRR
ncbi:MULTISPECIES: DUF3618 domain-containing protein [Brachybacterium]|uniref:DUF3618 domain-containing protein n=1 Tax=Brachybacterium TaxID=43668 RepID=UPI0006B44BA4|nr:MULTISPECIES: DUF3618 domain-containing protein [Brachybacterium]GAP80246.1 hypothetical protein Y09_3104 [Brachybacterium sp. SW0106-09]